MTKGVGEANRRSPLAVLTAGALLVSALAAAETPSQYIGPGSCAAASCHGSLRPSPRDGEDILHNEYTLWTDARNVERHTHSQAYNNLSNAVSLQMQKNLKRDTPPSKDPQCLACHSLAVSAEELGRSFDLGDGVSCELCHGPSTGWLGPHVTTKWRDKNPKEAENLGMFPTDDLVRRAEKCMTCHVGTSKKFVDHELIGAGHPDLVFELDNFEDVMPRHWRAKEDPAKVWGVGLAVQMKSHLERVADRAKDKTWPEYAEYSCFACHHDLTPTKESWRHKSGFPNRIVGNLPFNLSRYGTFRLLAEEVDPAGAKALDDEMGKLYGAMSKVNPDRAEVGAAAKRAADAVDSLVGRVQGASYDQAMTLRLLQSISGAADQISFLDERAGEHAAMALQSLWASYSRAGGGTGKEKDAKAALDELFKHLEKPSAYNAPHYAEMLKKFNAIVK